MDTPDYDDDDDGLNEDGWDTAISGRNCFVLAVDAGPEMFTRTENGKSHFHLSLECCKEILLSIARKQKLELVSIVLFGTHKTEGKHAPENVVLFQPLTAVTVTRIKKLLQVLDDECEEIRTKYGHSTKIILSQALHYCQSVIVQDKRKVYVKNVVLFTNNDDPHMGDVQAQHRSRKQAEEFLGHHIDFEVVGLGDFDSSKFYKELVLTSRGELLKDWVKKDPILSVEKILSQIDQITERYALRRCHLWLSNECALAVAITKLYSEPKKFRTLKVSDYEMEQIGVAARGILQNDDDEDEIVGESNNGRPDEKLPEDEPRFHFEPPLAAQVSVGDRLIPVTRAELKVDITGFRQGFTLVGFVNSDDVPLYMTKDPPYFMMAASNTTNVRMIFSHLLNACLRRGKSMVGWFKLTKSSKPQYVLLHPTPAGEYAKGREHSAGFILSKLSFSDDLTEPDEPEEEAAPSEKQLEAADGIVKKLTIPYSVDNFSDAEIRHRTNMIEALALDLEDSVEVDDDTDADLEGITERLGSLVNDFNDCDHLGPDTTGRKATTAKNLSGENAVEMIREGLANKLTAIQLRDLLKNEGVKNLSGMNKAMLVSIANKRFGGPQ